MNCYKIQLLLLAYNTGNDSYFTGISGFTSKPLASF